MILCRMWFLWIPPVCLTAMYLFSPQPKASRLLEAGVRDVRMAQLEANRPLVERFALQARSASFGGLFVVSATSWIDALSGGVAGV